jgi:uncharacterized protein (TIGR02452 family)
MNLMDRDLAAQLGRETVVTLDAGGYHSPSGRWVAVSGALAAARDGTIEYPPDRRVPAPEVRDRTTRFSVENAAVLAVGQRLAARGRVAALNFASAEYPGGGFLAGARAQEESIARSSGLFYCLKDQPMYAFHRARLDPIYSHYVIYSPDVPVFRHDNGDLLEQPWSLSIITCPAVHGIGIMRYAPHRMPDVPGVMRERTGKVLSVAALHGHRTLILGAWGCGAFGLDPEMMATIFKDALTGSQRGVFDRVIFAITDWSPERRFIGPFERAFAGV